MNIPNRVSPVSFDLSLPKGYMHLDFLESTGTQYIDTGVKLSNESEVRCKYLIKEQHSGSSWIYGGEVGSQLNRYGVLAYLSGEKYENLIYGYCGGDGQLPRSLTVRSETQFNNVISTVLNSERFTVNDKTVNFSSTVGVFEATNAVIFGFSLANKVTQSKCRIYTFTISRAGEQQVDYVPCISPDGTLGMYNRIDGSLKENLGSGQFIAGMTLAQARGLSLPAGGGEMTLSLPYEASVDRMVQEALEAARLNGWTLTVQYRDGELPAGWHREVGFIESTGTQYIDTDITLEKFGKAVHDIQFVRGNGYYMGFRAEYFSFATGLAFGATTDGKIWYCGVGAYESPFLFNRELWTLSVDEGVSQLSIGDNFQQKKRLPGTNEVTTYSVFSGLNQSVSIIAKIYTVKIYNSNNQLQLNLVPCIDAEGIPVMWDSVSKQHLPNAGTGAFIVGLETVEDVRKFFLPPSGGELTLSLPQAASTDFDSQLALDRARSHGWTLSIQYREELDVPEGYKRLEFLESTGTQYIDTGVKLSSESVIEGSAALSNDSTSSIAAWGSYSASDKYALFWHLSKKEGLSVPIGQYQELSWFSSNTIAEIGKKYRFKQTRGELWLDGELARTLNVKDFSIDFSAALFCTKQQQSFLYKSASRIYSFSISQAGVPQVDYVPCISPEGKLGMYNKVDGSLKENVGTGQFIAGLATVEDVRTLYLPETGGELTVSVPADTTDEDIDLMKFNNSTWLIAVQRRDNEN